MTMTPEQSAYPPLDLPKPVSGQVWIVDSGPISVMGAPLPVRMTVVRLANGGLLLHSPTRFSFDLKNKLETLGRIEHLVAPNSAHWMFVKEWQGHMPDAVTWAAPGLRKRSQVRKSGVRIDRDLGGHDAEGSLNEIDQVIVPGVGGFAEVALFHRASSTLILTDLVQNLEPEKLPSLIRPVAHLLGVTAPNGRAPAYLRAVIRLAGKRAKIAARQLVSFAPERVIFTHGTWFERDASARLRQSLDWLL